ncbi:MAG: response regulator transcription factor [Nitrospirae bacterium]|nr:response regulator transcription factor [Nitrospirota bacterium]
MKRILLVENNPRLRKGIRNLLEKRGFIIIEVQDFEKTLELSQINQWLNVSNVAIISLEIPEILRKNLLSALRNFNHHNILPIFTTAEDDLEVIKKINGLNGLDVMEKPFSFKEVIERIESYFRNHEVSV